MKTIHLIANAHLDPIWLWPWPAGLDSALATCRSACDRLDAHPDLHFARGEAWVYDMIERTDPALFDRIRAHVQAGQWHIVNGWWVQPDCNLPSGFAMRKQIELGKRYFTDRFGAFPEVAYNVDSFGHSAALPALMHDAGQKYYVMMRPQEHERELPARLFRWRGAEGEPQIITFRIAGAYLTRELRLEHFRKAATELPDGIDHTMCFIGIGDHGGGPTEKIIAWCREHAEAIDGWRMEFSHPQRFFDAVAGQAERLPLVTGELQMHAVGCYSVDRPTKLALRRAEHRAAEAEHIRNLDPAPPADLDDRMEQTWRDICLHQFHDTLGGTCIPSAYPQVHAQLGRAFAEADDYLQLAARRMLGALPDDPRQRLVLLNTDDQPFRGFVECEPWLEWEHWDDAWRLVDDAGNVVPMQRLHSEAMAGSISRLLFKVELQPGQMRCWHIEREGGADTASRVRVEADGIAGDREVGVRFAGADACMTLGDLTVTPRLALLDDASDTWSHHIDHYIEGPAVGATWGPATIEDRGPLMASAFQTGVIGRSDLLAEWRVYAGEPWVELRLRVNWVERFKVLKLVVASPGGQRRLDGIMEGHIDRANDGVERPLRDWTLAPGSSGGLGVVCPACYALDGRPERLRFTLLRSCEMARHDPHHAGSYPRAELSDRGDHEFIFRFSNGLGAQALESSARAIQRPPLGADLTRGMVGWPKPGS